MHLDCHTHISIPTLSMTAHIPSYHLISLHINSFHVPCNQVKRGLDGKDPRRVFLIDNFHHLGGGTIHPNFSSAYLVNPNASLGKYPNDLVHLSDVGYAKIALFVFQNIMKYVPLVHHDLRFWVEGAER